jgi:hypothetical protein
MRRINTKIQNISLGHWNEHFRNLNRNRTEYKNKQQEKTEIFQIYLFGRFDNKNAVKVLEIVELVNQEKYLLN